MNRPVRIFLSVSVLVAVAAGSFFAGSVYGQRQASAEVEAQLASRAAAFGRGPGQLGVGGNEFSNGDIAGGLAEQFGRTGAQGGATAGQIEQIDGNELLVSAADGSQVRVLVTDTTLIEKNASVSVSELALGETVVISGSENDDGSITARSVQVAPAGRLGGFQPGAFPTGQ